MRATLTLLSLALLGGCSAAGNTMFSGSSTAGSGTGGSTTTHTGAGGGAGGGLGFDAGPVPEGGPMVPAEVFAETATTLYKLDPNTKVVTTVGDFQGCNSDVIDIALDKDGNMFGTTTGAVYRIDKTTAVCTHIANGSYPNSLSFVPKGTLDPNVEALVGYDFNDNYIRIDTTTGAITIIGQSVLSPYASSGDIVSVIGGGTYLTVTGGPGPKFCADCIVEVDPKTGAVIKNIGFLNHGAVFGLAFWGGSAYGFANDTAFQIDLTNATTTLIPTPNVPPGIVWYGAGSRTSAPLTPTQ